MPCAKLGLVVSIAALFSSFSINALDLESAKEQACFPIKKTAEVDMEWLLSVKSWYYPLMSRLDLYLGSLELYGNYNDPTNLRESEMYYESCIKGKIDEKGLLVTGFNGKEVSWALSQPAVTDEGVQYQKLTLASGYAGVAYTTLTDNSTYSFLVVCWENNQISWGVTSTVDKLSEEAVRVIYGHAESLGFKREYFEELRYGYCNDERGGNAINVEEMETCMK